MFLDGSLGSRTAWMLEPYAGTRDRGMPITGEKDVRDAVPPPRLPGSPARCMRSAMRRCAARWSC